MSTEAESRQRLNLTTTRMALGAVQWRTRARGVLTYVQPAWVTLLIASAALNLIAYIGNVVTIFGRNDFRLYYAGAQVGLQYGWSHIYDVQLEQAAVAALQPSGQWYALLTPAPITWLVAPLTLAGYPAAYWIWLGLSLAILGAAAWYARPRHRSSAIYFIWWAALSPLWFSAYEGQVTMLVAAALLVGWRLLETRRDLLGGAVLAVALFKPHLVLLLPPALLVAGRYRAMLGFGALAAAAGVGMLVTLHLDGVQGYLATLFQPQPAGDTAETLRFALGGGAEVLVIQAVAVIAVIGIAIQARRTGAIWPALVAAVLGSFLLAIYWHPQDYLALDAAAAIMLAAAPLQAGLLVAVATAVVSTPSNLFTNRQSVLAWLVFAVALLGFLGAMALRQGQRKERSANPDRGPMPGRLRSRPSAPPRG